MLGSRTVKTLTLLLAAMTIGTFALMVLETSPISPAVANPAALFEARPSAVPVVFDSLEVRPQSMVWQNIIIHSNVLERRDILRECHFIVDMSDLAKGQNIRPTTLWKRQLTGNHTFVPGYEYNANSIGICIMGDFSRRQPTTQQMQALIALVRALQEGFKINADHVFLTRDLDRRSASPGELFPADYFNDAISRR